ncbi:MAG: ATP-dependent Clp protease adaptor ClpS [Fimbriimonadaceae bacterium]|nr:ATP-dependent Clp protease adaptor ClpS [Fimbriimonadaceae bacterium]
MARLTMGGALPVLEPTTSDTGFGGWIVTVFNNDVNTYQEVIEILMRATGCPFEEAYIEAWEIDHLGLSVVHHGRQEECERVAAVIATIGIEVRVSEMD